MLPFAGKTSAVHHVTIADEVLVHHVKRLWQLLAVFESFRFCYVERISMRPLGNVTL